MNRKEIKEKEIKFLAQKYQKNQQLFEKETLIDNAQFLEKIGIFIPLQENLPFGYLRLWPQDFIVEEILENGEILTVDIGDFFDSKKEFSENDKTIYATLVKCGLSTLEVVEEMAFFLNIENKKIQFAGIKDKGAITSQLISFRDVNIESVKKISSPYFFLKNAYSGKGVIEMGGLKGNRFTILLRTNKSFKEDEFLKNLDKIKKEGFYNFFYAQRFATPRLINWFWGLLILRGGYEKAVLSFICSPGLREVMYFKNLREEMRKNWRNWPEIGEIMEPFPLIFQNERKVIEYLKNNPDDFIGALNQIPEQVRLWIFAYASLLFNRKLSFCLKKGVKPPQKMPVIPSKDEKDWLFYKEFLEEDKIFSLPLKNLKPFSHIQWDKREINTKEMAVIRQTKIIPEGAVLNFALPKACYATTFLSQLFNLVSGLPPKDISYLPIDTKATLGQNSLKDILNKFSGIIHPKTENIFEKFLQNE